MCLNDSRLSISHSNLPIQVRFIERDYKTNKGRAKNKLNEKSCSDFSKLVSYLFKTAG